LLKEFKHRPALGFNFDPSHLIWQGVTPHVFLRDFASKVYHVHMKDAAVNRDGKGGFWARTWPSATTAGAGTSAPWAMGMWISRSIIRELNACGYQGPLSVEWEDSGMEREYGAAKPAPLSGVATLPHRPWLSTKAMKK
jgi:sugar phosphate isomerase/epimerase